MYIKAYKPELYHQVANLEVLESDSKFTKTPLENIKSAQEDADRHPTLVMKDGVCVAFFTLHEGDGPKDYTDNSQAFSLGRLVSINVIEVVALARGRLNYYLVM